MAGFSMFLVYITLLYYSGENINFLKAKLMMQPDVVHSLAWRLSFYIHITGGALALATGPFQFIPAIRKHNLKLHKLLGRVYVIAILFIGAPAGLYMAFFANGGPVAGLGFTILCLLWVTTTYKAVIYARNHQIKEHRQWMIRSFALTFAAVTLRLWVPILSHGFDVDYETTIIVTAWLSWVPNILVAEFIINKKKLFNTVFAVKKSTTT
jgi:uncharacterized membrane protein